MSHFAAAEDDHDFDMVAILEESTNLAEFDVKVIITDLKADFHLLKLRLLFTSLLTIFGFFLHLLILEFAPIDNLDYWWISIRRDLDEIDTFVASKELSVTARHNAKLFAISTNYTDLRITDFSIKSDMRSRFVTDDSSSEIQG